MSKRRMFSESVTESDFFMELSLTAQALYLHLGMKSDDDGFCASARAIVRTIGAQPSDLEELIAKGFVIRFDDGVVAIKHWRVNNYIRKDIYGSTEYRDDKALIYLKPNGIYTLDPDKGTPLNPDSITPRPRAVDEPSQPCPRSIDKVSIGKDSLGKSSLDKRESEGERIQERIAQRMRELHGGKDDELF